MLSGIEIFKFFVSDHLKLDLNQVYQLTDSLHLRCQMNFPHVVPMSYPTVSQLTKVHEDR